ncbi:hypothetical protein LguiA_022842 [Lonicera macranthoides]
MSDYLPKDVVADILTKLPLKTLGKCTCVCKQWYSLITNPSFISTRLNQTIAHNKNHNNHLLFIRHYNMFDKVVRYAIHRDDDSFDEFRELDCSFLSENEYFRIVGTCNGLICLSDDYDTHTDTIIIWNPLIRKSVNLPKPQFGLSQRGMCLLGFGFDSVTNDYKVVRIVYESTENYNFKLPPCVEVYTVRTGVWRTIDGAAPNYVVYNNSPAPAYVNGAVHWVATLSGDDDSSVSNLIVAFDTATEEFKEFTMPKSAVDKYVIKLSVMVSEGLLALVEYEKIWQSDYCWVWVMKEYGVSESWTRLLTIDMRGGIRTVVGFRNNDEVLLSARIIGMASYDHKENEIKYLRIHGTNRSFYADTYVESLVLLNRENRFLEQANSSGATTSAGTALLSKEEEDDDDKEDRVDEQK